MAKSPTPSWPLSANLGFLWKHLSLDRRIEAAALAGFDRVEFHDDIQANDKAMIGAALRRLRLRVMALNCRMTQTAGNAAIAGQEREAAGAFRVALDAAEACDAGAIHVLSGCTDAAGAVKVLAANLRRFADMTDRILLIEPMSQRARPGYALTRLRQAAEAIARADRTNLAILFDVYHVASEEADLTGAFRDHAALVGHVQISDPVTRHEPGPDIMRFLGAIDALGYRGAVGCEYVPAATVEEGLGWRAFLPPRTGPQA